jgi:hypothetical protein
MRYMPDTFALIILSNRYNQGVYDVQPVFNIIGATKDTTAGKRTNRESRHRFPATALTPN